MIYEIWDVLLENAEKEIKKVQKKCVKYNCEFNYEILDRYTKKVNDKYFNFVQIKVNGKAIINDYQLVGILEHTENGNIVHSINDEPIPEQYYYSDNYCEHCDSKRYRKQLFVLKNIKTNEYIQLGKSCVKLYTNGIDANRYLDILSCYHLLENLDNDIPNDYINYNSYKPIYKVDDILNVAIMITDKLGYASVNNCLDNLYQYSTKDLVYMTMLNNFKTLNNYAKKYNANFDIVDIDTDRADRIKAIKDYYLNLDNNTEFIHNVQTILKSEYVENNSIGYLAYLPVGYNKYLQKLNDNKKLYDVDKVEYFGQPTKRYKDIKIDNIKLKASYITDYGFTNIYEIVSEQYVFIWKTTKSYDDDILKAFKKVDLTIKSHSEYKSLRQTVVTRCKLY